MPSSSSRSTRGSRRRRLVDSSQQPSVEPTSGDLFSTGPPQTDVEMSEAQSNVSRRPNGDEHSEAVSLLCDSL